MRLLNRNELSPTEPVTASLHAGAAFDLSLSTQSCRDSGDIRSKPIATPGRLAWHGAGWRGHHDLNTCDRALRDRFGSELD
jgi:hypothetical protein